MKINEFAKAKNLKLTDLNKIVKQLFGTIKAELNDSEIEQINTHLATASELAALPPSERKTEIQDLKVIDKEETTNIERTLKYIGITNLKKLNSLYQSQLQQFAVTAARQTREVTTAVEQYNQQAIAGCYQNMAKNLQAVNEEFNAESFQLEVKNAMISGNDIQITEDDIAMLELELDLI